MVRLLGPTAREQAFSATCHRLSSGLCKRQQIRPQKGTDAKSVSSAPPLLTLIPFYPGGECPGKLSSHPLSLSQHTQVCARMAPDRGEISRNPRSQKSSRFKVLWSPTISLFTQPLYDRGQFELLQQPCSLRSRTPFPSLLDYSLTAGFWTGSQKPSLWYRIIE